MKIKVLAFAAFGEILGREREVELEEEASVKDLLDELASIVPGFREAAFEPSGILRDYVLLMRFGSVRQGFRLRSLPIMAV